MVPAVMNTAFGPFAVYILTVYLLLSVASAKTCTPGQSSTSGIIHLTGSSCAGGDENGLRFICGSAFKVDVNAAGKISLTPVEQGTFIWMGPGPYVLPTKDNPKGYNWGKFPCKSMNATGSFDGSNRKKANVMFYNDVGGPYSVLEVTGANQLTLVAAHTRGYQSPNPYCANTYKVTSGCVMGIAASKTITCAPGYIIKTGRFGVKYCAPCPPGTIGNKPKHATACTKCAAGYAGYGYAATECSKCEGFTYSKAGASECSSCPIEGWKSRAVKPVYFISSKVGCGNCPRDSWAYEGINGNPTQCMACKDGVKCCRTNPSANCPACPSGFKSNSINATFVLESANSSICYKIPEAGCAAAFRVKVLGTCQVSTMALKTFSPWFAGLKETCLFGEWIPDWPVAGRKIAPSDFTPFGSYIYSGFTENTKTSPPRVTFYVDSSSGNSSPEYHKSCLITYRSISPAAAKMGVPPANCPVGKPGCIIKKNPPTCSRGTYVSSNIDGKTLCLKCPPGTYNPKDTTATRCTSCPKGLHANGFANTACKK